MPYLQLDVPNRYPVDVKQRLARRMGDTFARIMQTTPELVIVAFRELGEGGLWSCGHREPQPYALLTCDIRRGRPAEQRAELAKALIDACVESLGLREDQMAVEFTQHSGDEMYRGAAASASNGRLPRPSSPRQVASATSTKQRCVQHWLRLSGSDADPARNRLYHRPNVH